MHIVHVAARCVGKNSAITMPKHNKYSQGIGCKFSCEWIWISPRLKLRFVRTTIFNDVLIFKKLTVIKFSCVEAGKYQYIDYFGSHSNDTT